LAIQGASAANYRLAAAPAGLPAGTAIYRDKPGSEPDELLGIIQPATGVELSILGVTFVGNALDNTLITGPDADTLSGLEGNDRLEGRGGQDSLYGGSGNDVLLGR
jgi:Ca2+-binding RTX toxin-like protein